MGYKLKILVEIFGQEKSKNAVPCTSQQSFLKIHSQNKFLDYIFPPQSWILTQDSMSEFGIATQELMSEFLVGMLPLTNFGWKMIFESPRIEIWNELPCIILLRWVGRSQHYKFSLPLMPCKIERNLYIDLYVLCPSQYTWVQIKLLCQYNQVAYYYITRF